MTFLMIESFQAEASPYLFLDAAGDALQCGLWERGRWLAFGRSEEDVLEALFTLVEQQCQSVSVDVLSLKGFFFCEGPGSLLALRLSAMVVNTLRSLPGSGRKPLWTYRSLSAAAQLFQRPLECLREAVHPPATGTILQPYRGGLWNFLVMPTGERGLMSDGELVSLPRPWRVLPQRRYHRPWPDGVTPLNYDFSPAADLFSEPSWMCSKSFAEAFVPEAPKFALWSGQRHRGNISPDG
jgi:tRNA threonylcarbamoyladenosine biosynthesis protein TsaB